MIGRKKNKPNAEDAAPVGATDVADETEATAEAESPGQNAEVPVEPTIEEQLAQKQDENLRLMAELRNVRQRGQREQQERLKYAEAEFARELLVVLDDLERTRQAAETADDAKAVADGVQIIYDHFLKVLKGRGIEPIESLGQRFDPERHEAMMQQPSDEHDAGMVIQEIARGYRMHERVIRPSKVIVSSGPAAGSSEDSGGEAEE